MGGVILLAVVIIIACFVIHRKNKKKEEYSQVGKSPHKNDAKKDDPKVSYVAEN